MLDNMIDSVINWLDMNGFEAFIDENCNNIVYYDDEEELKIFCRINEKALTKVIYLNRIRG